MLCRQAVENIGLGRDNWKLEDMLSEGWRERQYCGSLSMIMLDVYI